MDEFMKVSRKILTICSLHPGKVSSLTFAVCPSSSQVKHPVGSSFRRPIIVSNFQDKTHKAPRNIEKLLSGHKLILTDDDNMQQQADYK